MGLKPRWTWNAAKVLAAGNPNEAMFIIGACGHDDANLPIESKVDSNDRSRLSTQALLAKSGTIYDGLSILENRIQCPTRPDNFFLQQGLDESADVSNSMKQKIAGTQAPTMGASVIPAKYYHVYAGAFMACEMIEDGLPASRASEYPGKFAAIYRRSRLCSEMSAISRQANVLNESYRQALAKTSNNQKEKISVHNYLRSLSHAEMTSLWTKLMKSSNGSPAFGIDLTEESEEKTESRLNRVFAAKMYFAQSQCPGSALGITAEAIVRAASQSPNPAEQPKAFDCSGIPSSQCEGSKKR